MKLSPIKKEHLLQAADDLESSKENLWSEYWLSIPERGKEYPFKQLVRRAYEIATNTEIDTDFFQSNDGYRRYIEKSFSYPITFKVRDNITFFTEDDIIHFTQYAGKEYRMDNPQDKLVGAKLKQTIFAKTNTWARALNLKGFDVWTDNHWQKRGVFAKFSWANICRQSDRDKNRKVFFTVGVDPEETSLVYKLDCYHKSTNEVNILSPEQYDVFKRIVNSTDASWQAIGFDRLPEYDWEKLVNETITFIEHYLALYDEVIDAVWNGTYSDHFDDAGHSGYAGLTERPIPIGRDALPERRKIEYAGNGDYDKENKKKKEIGDKGENLVITEEHRRLTMLARADLAKKVVKVPDWKGYDILSFFPDGTEKYIEVKTTTGPETRPFYWSCNERAFMQSHNSNYCLYRIYNFDADTNKGDFFKIEENLNGRIIEEAIQYCVYIKNISIALDGSDEPPEK